jgi:hypothetical protein
MNVSGDDSYYHVTATDFAGNQGVPSTVENPFAGAGKIGSVPQFWALGQTSPNPFRTMAKIAFDLPEPAHVSVRVFDVQGSLVRVLTDQDWPGGGHSLTWDGATDTGRAAEPGIYFVRFDAGSYTATEKVMLIR